MSGNYLLDPKVSVTPVQTPGPTSSAAANRLLAASSGRALAVTKPNALIAFAQDTRDRSGGCLVKTGTILSTVAGSLAVVAVTAAAVAFAGAGSIVTEVVAGGVALNWLFGWASRPLIAAGALVLGEKPRETIKQILG